MKDILAKFKLYGPTKFIHYSISEVYRKIWLERVRRSFSQNGEDVIIHKMLGNKKKGFYVDVGANDPLRFNNTMYFYVRGWKGINIEPDFNCFKKIEKERPRDINLNLGIGSSDSKLILYRFKTNTLSTFSKEEAKKFQKQGYKLIDSQKVKIKKLSEILKKYLKRNKIDFMTIDTEGYDKKVLLSNDWSKYRPRVICIESVKHLIKKLGKDTGLESFLVKAGYKKQFDNGLNCFYVDKLI
jgi:FkbM family methyltransferase